MQKINYQELSRAKAHAEEVKKKIKEETKDGKKPDRHRLMRLQEEMYLPNIFDTVVGNYNRFRSPW